MLVEPALTGKNISCCHQKQNENKILSNLTILYTMYYNPHLYLVNRPS